MTACRDCGLIIKFVGQDVWIDQHQEEQCVTTVRSGGMAHTTTGCHRPVEKT